MPLLSEPVKPVGELKNWDFFIEFVEKGINGSSSAVGLIPLASFPGA